MFFVPEQISPNIIKWDLGRIITSGNYLLGRKNEQGLPLKNARLLDSFSPSFIMRLFHLWMGQTINLLLFFDIYSGRYGLSKKKTRLLSLFLVK